MDPQAGGCSVDDERARAELEDGSGALAPPAPPPIGSVGLECH